ncbi:acyl transferase/acyl hydrolase/lysophospholipase [Aspergillus undulatus]|uniref:acyl transferase/acyl hydrolase/lysophospholipase n=1 Tax=Aspergillus undulatus TaxID=1810928 RepID=UPI003CCCFB68
MTLPQLAFAFATKKSRRFQHIFSTTATSMDDLQSQLHNPETRVAVSKPVVLLFSGQNGSTTPSAKSFYDSPSLFRSRLHELMPMGKATDTTISLSVMRPSLQYASAMSWIDSGVTPQTVCGHSFGEWAALTVSESLSLEAGRASMIQKLWGTDTDLVATNKTPEQHLQPFLDTHSETEVEIACYNGPNNYVVAGNTKDIEVLAAYLQAHKRKSQSLPTPSPQNKLRFKMLKGMHAYHCCMADPIVDECAALSASIPLEAPTLLESLSEANIIARNTRGPVYFGDAIQLIVARLGTPCTFLEAGVGEPVVAMAQNALAVPHKDEHTFIPISGIDPRRSLAEATVTLWRTGTANAQFRPFHRRHRGRSFKEQGRSVELPPYQFERNHHCWIAAVSSVTDFPFIVRDNSMSNSNPNPTLTFTIDTRNARYQELTDGHTVVGTPICPVAVYLEMAAHAVHLLQNEDGTSRAGFDVLGKIVVQDLDIKAPPS